MQNINISSLTNREANMLLVEAGWDPIVAVKFLCDCEKVQKGEGFSDEQTFIQFYKEFSEENDLVFCEDIMEYAIAKMIDIFYL